MTDTELARIIEQMAAAWNEGKVPDDSVPVDPVLTVDEKTVGSLPQIADPKLIGTSRHYIATVWADPQPDTYQQVSRCLASAPSWVCSLIREVLTLRGILGDVLRDGGIEQGRREERKRVVDIIDRVTKKCSDDHKKGMRDWIAAEQLSQVFAAIRSIQDEVFGKGTLDISDPLPPEQGMREILRLRQAMRKVYEAMTDQPYSRFEEARVILAEALGEEP